MHSREQFKEMNQDRKIKFKAILDGMIEDLEEGASTTMEGMRGDAVPFPDPADRATLESDRNLTLRIRDRERKLRAKIEEALSRIEDGTFGICELCGTYLYLPKYPWYIMRGSLFGQPLYESWGSSSLVVTEELCSRIEKGKWKGIYITKLPRN